MMTVPDDHPNPAIHRYCWENRDCIRACIHSGDHKPGCRNCHTEEHLTPDCPSEFRLLLPEDEHMTEQKPTQLPAISPLFPPEARDLRPQSPAAAASAGRAAAERVLRESGACLGHYDDDAALTSGVGIGEPFYCDGSCRTDDES